MERIKIRFSALCFAALCVVGLTACQQTASSGTPAQPSGTSSQAGGAASGESAGQTTIYGKVTAVDGSKITLALGTLKNNGNFGSRAGSRPQSGAAASGRGTPPSGARGGSASGSSRGTSRPQSEDLLTLSGSTATITISDPGIIKRPSRRRPGQTSGGSSESASASSSASLSDIKIGTILSVVKNSDGTPASVMIFGGQG